jgi:hypothetical protein
MFKSKTTTSSLVIAAAAVLLIVTLLIPQQQQHLFSALASQHVRSRMSRMLYNKDVSHALFQPEKDPIVNVGTNRKAAMFSHIQSRRRQSNNRIEEVIGSLNNQTTENEQVQSQDQQQPAVISSLHQAYILPQSAS